MLSLLLILHVTVVPPVAGADLFLLADNAERAGSYENAAKLFLECAGESESLRPYALSRSAENLGKAGKFADAESLFKRVLNEHAQGPWVRLTLSRLGELRLKQNDREDAHQYFSRVLEGLEPRPWFLNALVVKRAVNALEIPARAGEGYAYYRDVAANAVSSSDRLEAARRLMKSSVREDRMWGIYGFVRAGSTTLGREALVKEAVTVQAPGGAPASLAALDEMLAAAQKDKAGSLSRLDALLALNQASLGARVWLMLVLREQAVAGEGALAESLADLMFRHFHEGRDAGDAYWWMAERYEKKPDASSADRMYRRLVDSCPKHVRAPRSLLNLGNRARKEGRLGEALAWYETLAKNQPNGQFTAEGHYRCAQIAEAQGNADNRLRFLKLAADGGLGQFYAHRALYELQAKNGTAPADNRRLSALNSAVFLRPMYVEQSAKAGPQAPVAPTIACGRLRFFGTNGLEEGEWEALDCILSSTTALEAAWYPVIAEAGYAYTAVQYAHARGWGLRDGKPGLERLRLEYPLAYWTPVKTLAGELKQDPYFLLAVARQESTFRAGIVSSAGATGVLQVMPDTAKWLAGKDDRVSADLVANLKSPQNSLRLGAVYLRRMLDRSGDNPVFALASYNAGPGNCDKWRARLSGGSLEQFMESIPFPETNDYVKRVLANYVAYHSLYPPPDEAVPYSTD